MKVDTSDIQTLVKELLSLPMPSRAFLADRLVESTDNYADPDIEAAWHRDVKRRLQEYEEGKVKGIPSRQVFREARKGLSSSCCGKPEARSS